MGDKKVEALPKIVRPGSRSDETCQFFSVWVLKETATAATPTVGRKCGSARIGANGNVA